MLDFEASLSEIVPGFAKPLYGLKPYQGFESLPLRHIICNFNKLRLAARSYLRLYLRAATLLCRILLGSNVVG